MEAEAVDIDEADEEQLNVRLEKSAHEVTIEHAVEKLIGAFVSAGVLPGAAADEAARGERDQDYQPQTDEDPRVVDNAL